jgi:hypothetical protein
MFGIDSRLTASIDRHVFEVDWERGIALKKTLFYIEILHWYFAILESATLDRRC